MSRTGEVAVYLAAVVLVLVLGAWADSPGIAAVGALAMFGFALYAAWRKRP